MSRKVKTLIITLGVLVLLGAAYYGSTLWNKKKTSDTALLDTTPVKLGNLNGSDIVKIEIPGLVFERDGNTWALVSVNGENPPGGIEVDTSRIVAMVFSLASLWVERTIDDEPEDLSIYGLDNPSARVTVSCSNGKEVVYLLGDMLPQGNVYYVMVEGDPKVYSVPSYAVKDMLLTLDNFRIRSLSGTFEFSDFRELHIEKDGMRIDIVPKPESVPPHLNSSFTVFLMTSPYKLTRSVDSQSLDNLLASLKGLQIAEFVNDNPSSLGPYGLDKPARIRLGTAEGALDLLIGNQIDEMRYAKLPNTPGVFTIGGLDPVINVKPFSIIDKFPLILNIDWVDHLSVTGRADRPLNADFEGIGDDGVYYLNGKRAEEKSFKNWYQTVIGLLSDAELPGPVQNSDGEGNITIEYTLNTPPGVKASITLIPYNRDFYALRQEGTMEFLISRNQVNKIFDAANAVTFE